MSDSEKQETLPASDSEETKLSNASHPVRHIQETRWEAPILSPKIFNEYPPEAQQAMLQAMREEQAHRHKKEKYTLIFSFVLVISMVVGSFILAYFGKEWGQYPIYIILGYMIIETIRIKLVDILLKSLKRLKKIRELYNKVRNSIPTSLASILYSVPSA